ncbi:MAG: hypothetical protein HUU06_11735, partial [Planctomycetaceae bacterium]|nr:hypothetical protein [Planctomycetaceae bacterium]
GSLGDARDLLDRLLADPAVPPLRQARRLRARVLLDCGEVEESGREFTTLVGEPECEGEDLLDYADYLWSREDAPATLAVLDRAASLDLHGEERLRLQILRSVVLERTGAGTGTLEALDSVQEEAGRADPPLRLRFLSARGIALWRHGRPGDALEALREALRFADSVGDHGTAAIFLQNLAVVAEDTGNVDEALEWAGKAVERASIFGTERSESRARLLLADYQVRCLRLEEAAATLDLIESTVEKLGSAMALVMMHSRRFELALARGDAEECLKRVEAIEEARTGFPDVAAGAMLYRARGLLLAGRPGEAAGEARRARDAFRGTGDPRSEEEALAVVARALRETGSEGPEREEIRGLSRPLTPEGAAEAALEAMDPGRGEALRAVAERLARSPWDRALLRERLRPG